ncbi:hypothetical protein EBZ80_14605 [bacterium]|nr:hypothetical protein [bacterium]
MPSVSAAIPYVTFTAYTTMTIFFVLMIVVVLQVLLPGVRPALEAAKRLPSVVKTVSETLTQSQGTLTLANQTLLQAQGVMAEMQQNPLLVGSGANASSAPIGLGFFRGG